MAKSMRCKRVKRLRAIKRDIVEPFYLKKEEAKLAALEAALAAPKLVVPASSSMEVVSPPAASTAAASSSLPADNTMEVEMADGSQNKGFLKASGGIGKKMKRKLKIGKRKKGRGKGQFRGKRNL